MKTIIFVIIGSLAILFASNSFASCTSCGVQSCYSDNVCTPSYTYAGSGYTNCGSCSSCGLTNCGCTDPYCGSYDNTCMSCSTCCEAFGNIGY